jgi:hypothetical protein
MAQASANNPDIFELAQSGNLAVLEAQVALDADCVHKTDRSRHTPHTSSCNHFLSFFSQILFFACIISFSFSYSFFYALVADTAKLFFIVLVEAGMCKFADFW